MELFDLTGRVAVVTGCSTGIGQAAVLGLLEGGADVVGVYHRTVPDEVFAKAEKVGRRFLDLQADLSDSASLGCIIDEVVRAMGRLDILVNNAGIIRRNEALALHEHDWDDVMDVNLKAPFFLSQAAARQFRKQHSSGKIINIASVLSFQGGIRVSSYTASKSGLAGITRSMANEWAAFNINVNAIAPGYIATNATSALRNDSVRNREIVNRIPAGRWGVPDDLQGAVIFLSSRASDYVHGCILAVDGGWLGR